MLFRSAPGRRWVLPTSILFGLQKRSMQANNNRRTDLAGSTGSINLAWQYMRISAPAARKTRSSTARTWSKSMVRSSGCAVKEQDMQLLPFAREKDPVMLGVLGGGSQRDQIVHGKDVVDVHDLLAR